MKESVARLYREDRTLFDRFVACLTALEAAHQTFYCPTLSRPCAALPGQLVSLGPDGVFPCLAPIEKLCAAHLERLAGS